MYKQISKEDKELIEAIRKKYNHATCSHSFAVLYIWRKIIGSELFIEDDIFSLCYRAKGENSWLFPCGSDEKKIKFIKDHLSQKNFSLCYARPEDLDFLKEHFGPIFRAEMDENDNEYVYAKESYMNLAGKKYRDIRYSILLVNKRHKIRVEEINESNFSDVEEITKFEYENDAPRGVLKTGGDEVLEEALEERDFLGLSGLIMYVDDKPYSMGMGFKLSDDTWDYFITKSVYRDSYLGYFFQHEIITSRSDDCIWINEEDDLGILGLRTFKHNLHPDRMNEMYNVFFDGGMSDEKIKDNQ